MSQENVEVVRAFWFGVDELIDAGDDVLLLWRQGGEGKASGVTMEPSGMR